MELTTTLRRIEPRAAADGSQIFALATDAGLLLTEPHNLAPRRLAEVMPLNRRIRAHVALTVGDSDLAVRDWRIARSEEVLPEVSLADAEWDGHFGMPVDYYDFDAAAAAAPDTRWSVVRYGPDRRFVIDPTADYRRAFTVAREHNLGDDYRADSFDDRYVVIAASLAEWNCYAAEGPRTG